MKSIFNNYINLMKPRISFLVLLTGYLGYYLGLRYEGLYNNYQTLLFLLIGMFFSSSGCSVLNQYLEKDFDAQMNRTKNRPIPSGKILPLNALIFGSILSVFGVFLNSAEPSSNNSHAAFFNIDGV